MRQRPTRRLSPGASLAWLALLLLICGVRADYFVAHPDCGLPGQAQQFVSFAALESLSAFVGVCNWGITDYSRTTADDFAGKCLSCIMVPAAAPEQCPPGWKLNPGNSWDLAPVSMCSWSQGCLGLPCPANTLEGATASCGGTATARSCCPLQPYVLCCQALQCSRTTEPPTDCVVDDKVLSPGQTATTTVYAVQRTGGLCASYSYRTQRTCLSNQTLTTGNYYDKCVTVSPGSDSTGCVVIPGYTFQLGYTYYNQSEAVLQDNTPWDMIAPNSKVAAAMDPVLMASRCDSMEGCAAFDAFTGSPTLRAYVPTQARWRSTHGLPSGAYRCAGTYVKLQTPSSCPRVPGYVFTPGVSWASADGTLSNVVCDSCGVSQNLARACNTTGSCAAFSNMHGLLAGLGPAAASSVLSQLQPYTSSKCMGLYKRVGSGVPEEVEGVDMLLCGASQYCTQPPQYTWSTQGSWVDVTVTLQGTWQLPAWLSSPNTATLQALPRLPYLRRLQFVCPQGTQIQGGVPRLLIYMLPSLQELVMSGCGITGTLPADLPALASSALHVVDLSSNALSGALPPSWGYSWQMSLLNLSANALTGPIPDSWGALPAAASSLRWGSAGMPQHTQATLNVVDLSYNKLEGPVPRSVITDTCLHGSMRVEFDTSASSGSSDRKVSGQAGDAEPILVVYGNPAMREWAGSYLLASSQRIYSTQQSRENLCGSYGYIIAICLMWGSFALVTLAILMWGRWRRARLAQGSSSGPASVPSTLDRPRDHSSNTQHHDTTTPNPLLALRGSASDRTSAVSDWWDRQWADAAVRQAVFITRLLVLAADMTLDILVVMWLWQDGATTQALVCIAFISLTQCVVAAGVFANTILPALPSVCALVMFGPLLFTLTPVLGLGMAVWNMFNPAVPLVAWRYLELQEFAVMLFQAPTLAISKTIIYAQQSRLGGGMYINNPLFVASILLSLTDMAISLFKLARYKFGPWARVRNAFSHLDQSRDVGSYHSLDNVWYETQGAYGGPSHAERYRLAFVTGKAWVDGSTMRNPLLMVSESQSGAVGPSDSGSVDGHGTSADRQQAGSSGSGAVFAPPVHTPSHMGGAGSGMHSHSGALQRLSRDSVASHGSGWSLVLPPPPTHTSLLQQSSLRLAVGSAMDALTSSLPTHHHHHHHHHHAHHVSNVTAGQLVRRNSGPAPTIPTHPTFIDAHRSSSGSLKPKSSVATPRAGGSSGFIPAQHTGAGASRLSQSGPGIHRSPLGKRLSNASVTSADGREDSGGARAHSPPGRLNAVPLHRVDSRSGPGYGPDTPVGGASPRVSGGHIAPHTSEVVSGLLRRVHSQDSPPYQSAVSSQAGYGAQQPGSSSAGATPLQQSPHASRRVSHAGPSGSLHVHVSDATEAPAGPSRLHAHSGSGAAGTQQSDAWQPHVAPVHTRARPASPTPPPARPASTGPSGRPPTTPRSPSPLAGTVTSPTSHSGALSVSLEGLFSSQTPASPAKPPLPPKPPTTPRSRPASAAAASPRTGIASLRPLPGGGEDTLSPRPSGGSGSGRFQAMPTPPPTNRHDPSSPR